MNPRVTAPGHRYRPVQSFRKRFLAVVSVTTGPTCQQGLPFTFCSLMVGHCCSPEVNKDFSLRGWEAQWYDIMERNERFRRDSSVPAGEACDLSAFFGDTGYAGAKSIIPFHRFEAGSIHPM